MRSKVTNRFWIGEAPEDNKVVIADITVYFREKEMQNQRHEVCLNYKGIGVME